MKHGYNEPMKSDKDKRVITLMYIIFFIIIILNLRFYFLQVKDMSGPIYKIYNRPIFHLIFGACT